MHKALKVGELDNAVRTQDLIFAQPFNDFGTVERLEKKDRQLLVYFKRGVDGYVKKLFFSNQTFLLVPKG